MPSDNFRYRPRNDYVLVKVTDIGQTPSGIAIPNISIQGKRFDVVAIGPDVDDLEIGDSVLLRGEKDKAQFYPLPNSRDLIVIRQEFVVLVIGEAEDEG